jgi:hypothetical protein
VNFTLPFYLQNLPNFEQLEKVKFFLLQPKHAMDFIKSLSLRELVKVLKYKMSTDAQNISRKAAGRLYVADYKIL